MADDEKLKEFRDRNVALLKEIDDLKAKYEGIDPEAVKVDRAKLAELTNVAERIGALETQLATEKTTRVDAQKRADALVVESTVGDVFSRTGGRPEARKFIIAQSASLFTVENGALKGTKFSPSRPGEPMTVDEWMLLQTRENAFCFMPSAGGGADPKKGGGSTGVKELRDPTPQQLGEFAADIKAGKVRVVTSS